MNSKGALSGVFIVIVLAAVGLLMSRGDSPAKSVADNTSGAINNLVDGAREFKVIANNFSFTASAPLTVKKGDKVRIVLQNTDGFHDLKIDEFGVATKKLNAGMSDAVEFTADKAGTFEYYCSIGNHRMMGMKGTLIVE